MRAQAFGRAVPRCRGRPRNPCAVRFDARDWFEFAHLTPEGSGKARTISSRFAGPASRGGKYGYRLPPSTLKAASGASSSTLRSARQAPAASACPAPSCARSRPAHRCARQTRLASARCGRARSSHSLRPRPAHRWRPAPRCMRRRHDRARIGRNLPLPAPRQNLHQPSVRLQPHPRRAARTPPAVLWIP